ncbi:MAG: hypothetical protein M3O36_16425 [Myxococcota bacterium]|nr:hypothetical protein [Myxococcota bacterium]
MESGTGQPPQLRERLTPQWSVSVAVPHAIPALAHRIASGSGVHPQAFTVPPPPQVCGVVQPAPQALQLFCVPRGAHLPPQQTFDAVHVNAGPQPPQLVAFGVLFVVTLTQTPPQGVKPLVHAVALQLPAPSQRALTAFAGNGQGVVLGAAVSPEHVPVDGEHVPGTWQASVDPQVSGLPSTHAPAVHARLRSHAFASEQRAHPAPPLPQLDVVSFASGSQVEALLQHPAQPLVVSQAQ